MPESKASGGERNGLQGILIPRGFVVMVRKRERLPGNFHSNECVRLRRSAAFRYGSDTPGNSDNSIMTRSHRPGTKSHLRLYPYSFTGVTVKKL
jgi:hypothetical protein